MQKLQMYKIMCVEKCEMKLRQDAFSMKHMELMETIGFFLD